MHAVEFQAVVQADGQIIIPEAYRQQVHGTVRVIILATDTRPMPRSLLQELLATPRPIPDFTPVPRSALYDREPPHLPETQQ